VLGLLGFNLYVSVKLSVQEQRLRRLAQDLALLTPRGTVEPESSSPPKQLDS
jgi:hypothetical protein